jgi:hypothetical protein
MLRHFTAENPCIYTRYGVVRNATATLHCLVEVSTSANTLLMMQWRSWLTVFVERSRKLFFPDWHIEQLQLGRYIDHNGIKDTPRDFEVGLPRADYHE